MASVIVIATKHELKLVKGRTEPIIITGVGYGNVYKTLNAVNRNVKIINYGFAGSNNLAVGTVCRVGAVKSYHPNVVFKESIYQLDGDVPCYTAADFVLETKIKEPCVFDMELYAILSMGFKNVVSIKTVSDCLDYTEYENRVETPKNTDNLEKR